MKFKGENYRRCHRYYYRQPRDGDLDGGGEQVRDNYMVVIDLKGLPVNDDGYIPREAIKAAPQAFYCHNTRTNQCYAVIVRKARTVQVMSWTHEDDEWRRKLVQPGEHYVEYKTFLAYKGGFYLKTTRIKPTAKKLAMWQEVEAARKAVIASKNLETTDATS